LGEIPKGWKVEILGQLCNNLDNLRKPLSELERKDMQGIYPYYGAMSIVDYVNDFIYEGIHLLLSEDGANVIDDKGHPALQYIWGKFWVNNHAHVIQGNNIISTEFLYLSLKETNVSHLVTGAAQPKINQQNMNSIKLIVPNEECLSNFMKLIKELFSNYRNTEEINRQLILLKEVIISKLATIEN